MSLQKQATLCVSFMDGHDVGQAATHTGLGRWAIPKFYAQMRGVAGTIMMNMQSECRLEGSQEFDESVAGKQHTKKERHQPGVSLICQEPHFPGGAKMNLIP
jgi:hypothetical protein